MTTRKPKKIEVVNPEEIPTKILAQSIADIAMGFRKMCIVGPLTERALIVLVQDACGGHTKISKETIKTVLDGLQQLSALHVNRRFL